MFLISNRICSRPAGFLNRSNEERAINEIDVAPFLLLPESPLEVWVWPLNIILKILKKPGHNKLLLLFAANLKSIGMVFEENN
jgi:hypothetical protein